MDIVGLKLTVYELVGDGTRLSERTVGIRYGVRYGIRWVRMIVDPSMDDKKGGRYLMFCECCRCVCVLIVIMGV